MPKKTDAPIKSTIAKTRRGRNGGRKPPPPSQDELDQWQAVAEAMNVARPV